MGTRLLLIRHGLTDWNNELRFQGHTDVGLSEEGRRQAFALQKRLAQVHLEAIYSSDLSRAQETAKIIAQPHGLSVRTLPQLRELNFGVWEGLTSQEVEKKYPLLLRTWRENPHLLQIPQGESFPSLQKRASGCIEEIRKLHPQGTVAVVTHGLTLAVLMCSLMNKPLDRLREYRHKNTALSVVAMEEERRNLELLSDISHLEYLEKEGS